MHVIFITPEVAPFSSSGGNLAEASAALPMALRKAGDQVTVITPFYQAIDPSRYGLARRLTRIPVAVGKETVEVGVIDGKFNSADVSLKMVDHPESFDRPGLYGEGSKAYPDNARRFYIFCAGALGIIEQLDLKPDVIFAVGWQAGLVPQLVGEDGPPVLMHLPDADDFGPIKAADLKKFGVSAPKVGRQASLLAAGIDGAARVTMPSPAYVRELCDEAAKHPLQATFAGLEGRLLGVLPGVEPAAWNPAKNHRIAAAFSPEEQAGKAQCKAALQDELGLAQEADKALLVMLGDLTSSGGADLALDTLKAIPPEQYQLVLVGKCDDKKLAKRLTTALKKYEGAIVHKAKVMDAMVHRLLAGADGVLLPHRKGPGAAHQLKAMRYGAVPVCCEVGGHRDMVVNFDAVSGSGTGITYSAPETQALADAIQRLVDLVGNEKPLAALRANTMRHPFTWERSATFYREIFKGML